MPAPSKAQRQKTLWVAGMPRDFLIQAGKKAFQVIRSSQKSTNPISGVDDARSANWLKEPNQSGKTT